MNRNLAKSSGLNHNSNQRNKITQASYTIYREGPSNPAKYIPIETQGSTLIETKSNYLKTEPSPKLKPKPKSKLFKLKEKSEINLVDFINDNEREINSYKEKTRYDRYSFKLIFSYLLALLGMH
jgi:hypothetical protein